MAAKDTIAIDNRSGYLWAIFPETVTIDNCRQLEARIESKLTGKNDRVVVDLSKTQNIYSSGFGLLIRLKKRVTEAGGTLSLVNVSQKIRQLVEGMHLDKVFAVFATDVEFEISQDEVWKARVAENGLGFVFVAQLEQGTYRLALSGTMDTLHDLSLVSEFRPDSAVSRYVVDLSNLDSMDTYGAQLFLELLQRIGKSGGKCAAYGATEIVRTLLGMLNIDTFAAHYKSEKEALESFRV